MNTTNLTVKTKADARATAVETALTIDWEGMSADDIRALAQQALIVKVQSGWRANGIPEGEQTILATDYKVGARAPRKPADIMSLVGQLTDEQKAALLAKLMG